MKRTLQFMLSMCVAAWASANPEPVYRLSRTDDGRWIADISNSSTSPAQLDDFLWDNVFSSTSVRRGVLAVGGDEVGEICYGRPGQGGILYSMGISIFNTSRTMALQRLTTSYRCYSLDGDLLLEETLSNIEFLPHLPPNSGATMFFDYGLGGPMLPDNFILTGQFSDPVGPSLNELGVSHVSPMNVGTSEAYYINRTTGQQIMLADSNDNLKMSVSTVRIPSPASTTLLASSSLLALRRRR